MKHVKLLFYALALLLALIALYSGTRAWELNFGGALNEVNWEGPLLEKYAQLRLTRTLALPGAIGILAVGLMLPARLRAREPDALGASTRGLHGDSSDTGR